MRDFDKSEEDYWDKRARLSCVYKGDYFYTISAVPYYYKRRNYVLKRLLEVIERNNIRNICDIGCGDGEFMKMICKEKPEVSITGIDASIKMLDLAKNAFEGGGKKRKSFILCFTKRNNRKSEL